MAVYDATGKQGAGLFMGALTWKGNLHECLDTLQHGAASVIFSEEDDTPRAQYCSIFLQTPQWLVDAFEALVRCFRCTALYFFLLENTAHSATRYVLLTWEPG